MHTIMWMIVDEKARGLVQPGRTGFISPWTIGMARECKKFTARAAALAYRTRSWECRQLWFWSKQKILTNSVKFGARRSTTKGGSVSAASKSSREPWVQCSRINDNSGAWPAAGSTTANTLTMFRWCFSCKSNSNSDSNSLTSLARCSRMSHCRR
jgi:hypothetical protein